MTSTPIDQLRDFGRQAYTYAGLPAADAELVVEIQLQADMRGVDTHGFQRLPWYVGHLRAGRYNAATSLATIAETPSTLLVDGDNGNAVAESSPKPG